jgi:hypothetical protein
MIRPRFLSPEDRAALVDLAQAGLVEHRVARRANALVLLDDGLSCETIAIVLLDDDTVRGWRKLYDARGLEGLTRFAAGGCFPDPTAKSNSTPRLSRAAPRI